MSRVRGQRNQDEKKNRGIDAVKLRGRENDNRFQKIKCGCDRRAPSPEDSVRNVAGRERTDRSDKRDEKSQKLKLGRLVIDVMDLLHETREPLIDPLPHGSGTGVSKRDDPNHWICDDRFENVEYVGLDMTANFLFWIDRREFYFLRRVFHN